MLDILKFLTNIDFQRLSEAESAGLVFALDWRPVWIVLMLAVAVFLGTLYVSWLYRRESIVLSKGKRALLTAMRVICILIVVFILLGPKLIMRKELPKEEVVVVLYDTSQSMSLPYGENDLQVTVPLAKIYGVLEPDRILSEKPLTSAEEFEVMKLSEKQRIDVVRQMLQDQRLSLLKRISRTFDVAAYSFNSDLVFREALDKADPESPEADAPAPSLEVTLDDAGQTTALGDVIRRLFDRKDKLEGLGGKNVVAVVVFTDGRVNQGETLGTTGRFLARNGVPVFPVGIGHHEPPPDVQLTNMTMDPVLPLEQWATIGVKVTAYGLAGDLDQPVDLQLLRRDPAKEDKDENWQAVKFRFSGRDRDEPAENQRVFIPAGTNSRDVSLVFKPDIEGNWVYMVKAAEVEGEVIPRNNMVSRLAEVSKAKLKVLLIDSYPRWEYRYLRDMLVRDKERIDSACYLVFDPYIISPEGSMVDDDEFKKVPADRKTLGQFHVIIIGDVPIESLEAQAPSDGMPFSAALSKVVREDGRGVIFIAGEYHNPYSYGRTFKFEQQDYTLADIIPVLIDKRAAGYFERRGETITKGFSMAVTREGLANPLMRFSGRDVDNKAIWESMQHMFWFATNKGAKLGATVLAEHPIEMVQGASTAQKIPLIATLRAGQGRVLYMGVDETWRWRWRVGDLYTSVFWNNALRMVAGQRRTLNVQLEVARDAYNLGEKVEIEVAVRDREGQPYKGNTPVTARVVPQVPGVEPYDVTLTPMKDQAGETETGRYLGAFTPRRDGSYVVEVKHPLGLTDAEGKIEEARSNLLVSVPKLEFENPAMARQELIEMAAMTGKGKFVTLGEVDSLPSLISSIRQPAYVPDEFPINRAPLLFILFLVCISTEWAVRKFNRLL